MTNAKKKRRSKRGGVSPPAAPPRCSHRGDRVRVGEFTVLAGGTMYLRLKDLEKADALVCLLEEMPSAVQKFAGQRGQKVLHIPLKDFGGVPEDWEERVWQVIALLEDGKRILIFCKGGHGRTGTLLASLLALVESAEETPDPIAAVRNRYCQKAVETDAQRDAVYALRAR